MTSKENLVSAETKEVSDTVNSTRRKFTSAGLATSGIVMTLASNSVLGAGVQLTPSGFTSGNLSRGTPAASNGKNPSFWKNDSGFKATIENLSFNDISIFPGSSTTNKCSEIILGSSHQAYFLAALLNARAGYTPFLTENMVIVMHNQWNTTRTYKEPSSNTTWDEAKILTYLQKTCE